MIVRILGEGQFRVDDAVTAELNQLDTELESAVEHGDEPAFRAALTALLPRCGRRDHRCPQIAWSRRI